MIWVVNSHNHRQVASTILSIVLKPLHRLTPARSLSRGLGRARSYNKVCTRRSLEQSHLRCPKLRTSKGHLVYKRPPARSQLRYRKPILRHACYNYTRSTHVQYEQKVSSQNSTKSVFIDLHI